jgi:hypothetical protein
VTAAVALVVIAAGLGADAISSVGGRLDGWLARRWSAVLGRHAAWPSRAPM